MSPETLPLRSDPAEAPPDRPDAARGRADAGVPPLLVDTDEAATLCAVSPASWYRLKAAGKTPAPIHLGGKVLYRVEDLRLWVAMGCPTQKEYAARRAANANGRPR